MSGSRGLARPAAAALGAAALGAAALVAGCVAEAPPVRRAGVLELRYRMGALRLSQERTSTSTAFYRSVLARSLSTDCRMVPSDSRAYQAAIDRCGITRAVIRGAARLLLERAASPVFLQPVRLDGRIRWIDLPDDDSCGG